MPTINIKRQLCRELLGTQTNFNPNNTYTNTEFDFYFEQLCFNFGIELDEITTELEIQSKHTRTNLVDQPSAANPPASSPDDTLYKIEIPANRADLFSGEGILNSLKNYLNPLQSLHNTNNILKKVIQPPTDQLIRIVHSSSVDDVRPYVIGCIFRSIELNNERYRNFIEVQEKLHLLVGRNRTLVSMGTHDLDSTTLQYPIHYRLIENTSCRFIPLNRIESMNIDELYKFYENEPNGQIKHYLHIINKLTQTHHPVIVDSANTVLSLPPVINSNQTKISASSKNILLEITGTNLEKMTVALNCMILSFIQYCRNIECIGIEYNNQLTITPSFTERRIFDVSIQYLNESIGIQLSKQQIIDQLARMELYGTPHEHHTDILRVQCGINRTDILHSCDIMEDLAISTGFDTLQHTVPIHQTIGLPNRINHYSDQIRLIVSQCGFLEVLTFTLISQLENYSYLLQPDTHQAVVLDNSSTIEFDCVRSTLIPGLLKTLSSNISQQLPIQIYEVGDICIVDQYKDQRIHVNNPADTGASNHRRVAAAYCGTSSAAGYGIINGLIDHIMLCNSILHQPTVHEHQSYKVNPIHYSPQQLSRQYYLQHSNNPTYLESYRADIVVQLTDQSNHITTINLGTFGTLNPDVCTNFRIPHPVNCVEIDLQPLIDLPQQY